MDLTQFSSTDDVVMEVRDPNTGEPLRHSDGSPVTITFFNVDTKQHIAARNALVNKERALKARQAVVEVEDDNKIGADFFAAITKSWSGIQLGGDKLEFSAANAKRIYGGTDVPWLAPQLAVCLLKMGRRKQGKVEKDDTAE